MVYDVILSQSGTVNTGYKIKQGDYGNVLRIVLQDIDYSDATIKAVFRKPDGNYVEYAVTQDNGVITYTMTGIETQCPGTVYADIKVYKTNSRISTATFYFTVSNDTYTYSRAYSDMIETAIETMNQATTSASAIVEAKTPSISNESNISVAGYAADARQINPEVSGSLANTVKGITDKIVTNYVAMNTTYLAYLYSDAGYRPRYVRSGNLVNINGDFEVHTIAPSNSVIISGLPNAAYHRWVPIFNFSGTMYLAYLTGTTITVMSDSIPVGNYYINISYISD